MAASQWTCRKMFLQQPLFQIIFMSKSISVCWSPRRWFLSTVWPISSPPTGTAGQCAPQLYLIEPHAYPGPDKCLKAKYRKTPGETGQLWGWLIQLGLATPVSSTLNCWAHFMTLTSSSTLSWILRIWETVYEWARSLWKCCTLSKALETFR
jgi:hypothetical protein